MNKDICKRCYGDCENIWLQSDDLRWQQGIIGCPARGWAGLHYRRKDFQLPKACPYLLEQLILGQEDMPGEDVTP